jgi:hypothetical protein
VAAPSDETPVLDLLTTAHLEVPPELIIGAASMHAVLAAWRDQLQADRDVEHNGRRELERGPVFR